MIRLFCISGAEASNSVDQQEGSNVITSFPVSRIIFCARGKQDSEVRCCLAFTASHGTSVETGLIQCHVFRCSSPDVVAKILNAFAQAFRRVPSANSGSQLSDFKIIMESSIEIKEEDSQSGKLTSCARDKEASFRLRCNVEKKICLAFHQDLGTSSRVMLNIEKCFGKLAF